MLYNFDQCRKCKNKGFDFKQGLICSLTSEKPSYISVCEMFNENPEAEVIKPSYTSYYSKKYIEGRVNGWIRFANFIIDRIIILVISVITGLFIGFSGGSVSTFESIVIARLIIVSYYIIFEASFGQSIGKFATGTVVVTEDGEKAPFSKILGRSFCRIIPFEPFSFLGSEASGWHDSITGTRVIDKSFFKKPVLDNKENLLDVNL